MKHHLQDERLLDCYVAERRSESIDPPLAEHLADCDACAARYAELSTFMDALRTEGEAEADAIFTPERLRAQRQQIAHRIELVGRPARIISFPRPFAGRNMTVSGTRPASRSIAAVAAAALFVGAALGASYQFGTRARFTSPALARATAPQRLAPIATRGGDPAEAEADDAFLSDLELALERPHTRELVAFDAFTPHVREVRGR